MKRIIFILFSISVIMIIACNHNSNDKGSPKNATKDLYKIEEGFVDAHGVLIYYKIIGQGKPLLIVHGGPGASHDYFLPYLLPLARTNRLIFIDERGSGQSQKLENALEYTVKNMVED